MTPKALAAGFLTFFFLVSGIAMAGEYQATKKADDMDVALTIDKNPPVVGKNNVAVTIKDSTGKPVTDATLRLEYGMAAMPGMPAMNYKADFTVSGEKYTTPMPLSMAGPWFVNVKILRGQKVSTAKFNVDVQ